MRIYNYSYRFRGFARLADYAIRWEAMISEKAKHKARVLSLGPDTAWAYHRGLWGEASDSVPLEEAAETRGWEV